MTKGRDAFLRALPWALLALGLAFIALALINQTELNVVLTRASRICLECIGIG